MDIVQIGDIFPTGSSSHDTKTQGVIVYKDQQDNLFHAKIPNEPTEVIELECEDLHQGFHGVPLPLQRVYPNYIPAEFTTAPERLPRNFYIKEPLLLRYNTSPECEGNLIAERVRHEAIASVLRESACDCKTVFPLSSRPQSGLGGHDQG